MSFLERATYDRSPGQIVTERNGRREPLLDTRLEDNEDVGAQTEPSKTTLPGVVVDNWRLAHESIRIQTHEAGCRRVLHSPAGFAIISDKGQPLEGRMLQAVGLPKTSRPHGVVFVAMNVGI
ncbi:hypothetical protein V1478_018825 [Vespula squamosa]|uniref:Uncharacterized protein n=1 Tax=Vespula squamosa TaxID=30214 RepID=A0ABD1ZTY0_VESSQ